MISMTGRTPMIFRESQMAELIVITREGNELVLEAGDGLSVMEVVRDGGVDELLALCGGCCSCATCHLYVDPDFPDNLPPVSDAENHLLHGSNNWDERSRISCLLLMQSELSGLIVTHTHGEL